MASGVSYSSRRRRIRKATAEMCSEMRQVRARLERCDNNNGPQLQCVIQFRPDRRVPQVVLSGSVRHEEFQRIKQATSDLREHQNRGSIEEQASCAESDPEKQCDSSQGFWRPQSRRSLFRPVASSREDSSDIGAILRQLMKQNEQLSRDVKRLTRTVATINQEMKGLKDCVHSHLESTIGNLNEIVEDVRHLREDVHHLRAHNVSTATHLAPPENIWLPLNSLGALTQLEGQLAEDDGTVGEGIVLRLATTGGKDVKDAVYRMMPLLMTDAVAQDLNWTGFKKTGFKELKIKDIVHKALRCVESCKGVTEAEFQNQLVRYLKGAGERHKGRKRPGTAGSLKC